MTTAVYIVRCPDDVVRRPIAPEADGLLRRKATHASGSKGKCCEPCPGGPHLLERHESERAFVVDHEHRMHFRKSTAPAVDPIADSRPWAPKRDAAAKARLCDACGAESFSQEWIKGVCPRCKAKGPRS